MPATTWAWAFVVDEGAHASVFWRFVAGSSATGGRLQAKTRPPQSPVKALASFNEQLATACACSPSLTSFRLPPDRRQALTAASLPPDSMEEDDDATHVTAPSCAVAATLPSRAQKSRPS